MMGLFMPQSLSPDDAHSVVSAKLEWVRSICLPREIWLFGSAADGTMTEASDVDIALVFDTRDALLSCRRRLLSSPRSDDWPVDLVFFLHDDFVRRSKIGGLPMIIINEGKRVFPEEAA